MGDVGEAVRLAYKAVELDNSGNYAEALDVYATVLELIDECLEDADLDQRTLLEEYRYKYYKRVETLKLAVGASDEVDSATCEDREGDEGMDVCGCELRTNPASEGEEEEEEEEKEEDEEEEKEETKEPPSSDRDGDDTVKGNDQEGNLIRAGTDSKKETKQQLKIQANTNEQEKALDIQYPPVYSMCPRMGELPGPIRPTVFLMALKRSLESSTRTEIWPGLYIPTGAWAYQGGPGVPKSSSDAPVVLANQPPRQAVLAPLLLKMRADLDALSRGDAVGRGMSNEWISTIQRLGYTGGVRPGGAEATLHKLRGKQAKPGGYDVPNYFAALAALGPASRILVERRDNSLRTGAPDNGTSDALRFLSLGVSKAVLGYGSGDGMSSKTVELRKGGLGALLIDRMEAQRQGFSRLHIPK